MSIFQGNSTPDIESPQGHEEIEAEQMENQDEFAEESAEQEEVTEELATESEPDPEAGHSEQLFAGKYKTTADLENAYLELQRQFTRQRMEQRAIPAPQVPQPAQQPATQQEESLDLSNPESIIDAINRDPLGTIAKIAQNTYQQAKTVETQQQAFQRGIDEVAATYKEHMQSDADVENYFGKVREICLEMGVNPKMPNPRILKMAAQELYGVPGTQTVTEAYKQAKAAVQQQTEQNRRLKQGLSAPAGAKPKETPKTAEELVADSIVGAGRRGGIFAAK